MKIVKNAVVKEKAVETVDVEDKGLEELLGKKVLLFCMNYFYAGVLVGVNEKTVLLQNGGIVYETGAFSDSKFKDFQEVGKPLRVYIDKIESYCEGK